MTMMSAQAVLWSFLYLSLCPRDPEPAIFPGWYQGPCRLIPLLHASVLRKDLTRLQWEFQAYKAAYYPSLYPIQARTHAGLWGPGRKKGLLIQLQPPA